MLKLFVGLLTLLAVAVSASAQSRERFGISAKAGGVNAVTGKVSVTTGKNPARQLTSKDDLESGDIVSTDVGGQVEVLLNPGSYLRLAEQSEFVMEDTSLDNLLVRLRKGSAIVEVTGPSDLKMQIPVVTEQQRLTIVRPGVYRINASASTTELFVRKGRVQLGNNEVIKGGKKATFSTSGPTIAKISDSDKDEFDDWSKSRGQTLARANAKLSARTVNGYLLASSWENPGGFGSSFFGFGHWGLWTWSPFASCYTFLPFYFGWGTPYGGYYGAYYPGGGYYRGYHNPTYGSPVITNNSGSGTGSGSPGGGTSGGSGGGGFGGSRSGGMSSPSSTPSMAGPRDPDSGSRQINTIKPPRN
jgi:uncharacterized membrane protein YgcG